MLFNSIEFIFVFLPISFFIYFWLNNRQYHTQAKVFLVVASLFFYSWWNVVYLPLILLSMAFNFWSAGKLRHAASIVQPKKAMLIMAVAANLLLLAYFKYSDFFIENINTVFESQIGLLNLALPLAISFFTFQQIAYLVDSFRGQTDEKDALN